MTALLLGVGNVYRRDDGVGIAVMQQLGDVPGLRVQEASGEGGALLELMQTAATVFIVDAAASGAAAGTIHRFDAHGGPLPTRFFHYSTHAFSVAEAVELARALGQLPERLIVYGIEGADFGSGPGLTPAVAQAAAVVSERLALELAALV